MFFIDCVVTLLFFIQPLGYVLFEITFTDLISVYFTSLLVYFTFPFTRINSAQNIFNWEQNRPRLFAERYSRDIIRVYNKGKVPALDIEWEVYEVDPEGEVIANGKEEILFARVSEDFLIYYLKL